MGVREQLDCEQSISGIAEYRDFAFVELNAGILGSLSACANDVLGERRVLRKIGWADAIALILSEIVRMVSRSAHDLPSPCCLVREAKL